jgi:TetR/AcrR family transcriptional regulator
MAATRARARLGSRGQPQESRDAILRAAIREFARGGVAGARTDAIARAAGVNKALLYYYFHDKEALYAAAIDHVFEERNRHLMPVLEDDVPPGEKLLRVVGAFFDFLAAHPAYRELVQRELMVAPSSRAHLQHILQHYIKPIYEQLVRVLQAGIDSGVFRPVDPLQFVPSITALVVHYFGSAPLIELITQQDPLSPERLAARRAAVLDFISAALFQHTSAKTAGGHR